MTFRLVNFALRNLHHLEFLNHAIPHENVVSFSMVFRRFDSDLDDDAELIQRVFEVVVLEAFDLLRYAIVIVP